MTANPNLFFEDSNDFIQHKINQARLNAERTLAEAEESKRQHEKEANEIIASVYDDAAEIALAGIANGLDVGACYGISSALRLQVMIVRGDTTS